MNNMYSLTPKADEKYSSDPVFRHLVDVLRASLRDYSYTPTELREAVILACTLHERVTIRPMVVYMDEAKNLAMFGGAPKEAPKTANGANATLDFLRDRLAVTKGKDHEHVFDTLRGAAGFNEYRACACGLSDVYYYSLGGGRVRRSDKGNRRYEFSLLLQ